MSDKVKPPDRLYLQRPGDGQPDTHCDERINEDDIEYIRIDFLVRILFDHALKVAQDAIEEQRAKMDAGAEGVGDGLLPSIRQPCATCGRSGVQIRLEMTDFGWRCEDCRYEGRTGQEPEAPEAWIGEVGDG